MRLNFQIPMSDDYVLDVRKELKRLFSVESLGPRRFKKLELAVMSRCLEAEAAQTRRKVFKLIRKLEINARLEGLREFMIGTCRRSPVRVKIYLDHGEIIAETEEERYSIDFLSDFEQQISIIDSLDAPENIKTAYTTFVYNNFCKAHKTQNYQELINEIAEQLESFYSLVKVIRVTKVVKDKETMKWRSFIDVELREDIINVFISEDIFDYLKKDESNGGEHE